jgi:hypothetical protein
VETGAELWSRTNSQINADLIAAGVEPPNGGYQTTQGAIGTFAVPGTPYFVVGLHQASGVDTSSGFAYYRIPETSTPELVGGFSGREGDISGVDEDSGLGNQNASALHAMGWVNGTPSSLSSSDPRAATHNTVAYQYPLAVCWESASRVAVWTMPSINQVLNGDVGNQDQEDWWVDKIEDMESAFDGQILNLRGNPAGGGWRQRGFFLPNTTDGDFFYKWQQLDIDQHIAGSEAVTSTFLQTHDSTYSTGFISSLQVIANPAGGGSATGGLQTDIGSTAVVQANATWDGYPFTDETDNFDGTSGTATNNLSMAPSCFPLYADDIDGPWLLFFPKVFRNQSHQIKS